MGATKALDELEQLRAVNKPELRARLEQLYRAGRPIGPAREEADALEAQLQALDRRALELGERLSEPGVGWERHDAGLGEIRVEAPGELVRGRASLSYMPCNLECVHGPYSIMPVAALAAHLLAPGESLATLRKVSWLRPMREVVEILVFDARAAPPLEAEPAFVGSFLSSADRELGFMGVPRRGEFVTAQSRPNQVSQALANATGGSFDPVTATYSIPLGAPSPGQLELLRELPVLLGTLLDVVSIVILNIHRGLPMLSCGFTNFPLAQLAAAQLSAGLTFELREQREQAHPSRTGLTIVPYAFRYRPFQHEWGTMIMAEASSGLDQMNEVLRGGASPEPEARS